MILDVGCGLRPHGHVNVDIYRRKNPEINSQKIIDVDVHKITNFVLASGEKLPFRNESFNEVYCSHVIEHVKNPYRLLSEIRRVCEKDGKIIIKCPHRLSTGAKGRGHRHYLNLRWFEDNVKGESVDISLTRKSLIPFFEVFRLPYEIIVKVRK